MEALLYWERLGGGGGGRCGRGCRAPGWGAAVAAGHIGGGDDMSGTRGAVGEEAAAARKARGSGWGEVAAAGGGGGAALVAGRCGRGDDMSGKHLTCISACNGKPQFHDIACYGART